MICHMLTGTMSPEKLEDMRVPSTHAPVVIQIPGSKSMTHRAFMLGAQTQSGCRILNPLLAEDTRATLACLEVLGMPHQRLGPDVVFPPVTTGLTHEGQPLDCKNSGTTLRLFLGQAARLQSEVLLTGDASLRTRPNHALLDALRDGGVRVKSSNGCAPVHVSGPIRSGCYRLNGQVSSQFASSLLCALAMTKGDSTLSVLQPILSRPYLDMTVQMLQGFGYAVHPQSHSDGMHYSVSGCDPVSPLEWTVEGDWSTALFPTIAGLLTQTPVELIGLSRDSVQGDRRWLDIVRAWGAECDWNRGRLRVRPGTRSGDQVVDLGACPDLFPGLCVLAAFRHGKTLLHGAPQLRYKESDRIRAMVQGLRALSVDLEEREDGVLIHGGRPTGGRVDGVGDHRIYMAFSVMGLGTSGGIDVSGYGCEAVSYPDFHLDLDKFR